MRANLRIVQSCCPGAHLFIHYRLGGKPSPGPTGREREESEGGTREGGVGGQLGRFGEDELSCSCR
jgi:hypothetical protein